MNLGQEKERWIPDFDSDKLVWPKVFFISEEGAIWTKMWDNGDFDRRRASFLGAYKTMEEAQVMRDKIEAFVTKEIGVL